MKRSTQQFLNHSKQLDKAIDENIDAFLAKRKWLTEGGVPEILPMTEDDIIPKIENEYAIETASKKIKEDISNQ